MLVSKYKKLGIALGLVLLGAFFINRHLKDDNEEIGKALKEFDQTIEVKHIEYLNPKEAIAFYEEERGSAYFGQALMKKRLLGGWIFNGGSASELVPAIDFCLSFSNLEYDSSTHTDLLFGIIAHIDIDKIKVETESGNTYDAEVIEYDAGKRFWFLLTDGDNTVGSMVTGLSAEGEIIEQKGI